MATINISDLQPADYETFFDTELSPEEIAAISGGGFWGKVIGAIVGGVVGGPTGAIVGAYVGDKVGDGMGNDEDEEIEVRVHVN